MALQLSGSTTHPVTFLIDDEPVPGHVKKFNNTEVKGFQKRLAQISRLRGSKEITDADDESREDALMAFTEACIRAYLTFEPGGVQVDGVDIVTGDQIYETFCARADVLAACYLAILSENCLGKAAKKNLKSQDIFSPGSTPRKAAPDGPSPETTAANAEPSTTAAPEDATDKPEPIPSGAPRGQVH